MLTWQEYQHASPRFVRDTVTIEGVTYITITDPMTGLTARVTESDRAMLLWLFRGYWCKHAGMVTAVRT